MVHWLVFAGLGPPLGWAVILTLVVLFDGAPPSVSLSFLGQTLAFSYVLGLVPALMAAALVQYLRRWNVPHEWLAVGVAGVVVGLGFVAMLSWITGTSFFAAKVPVQLGHIATCLVPTWVCWYLSKGWAARLGKSSAS